MYKCTYTSKAMLIFGNQINSEMCIDMCDGSWHLKDKDKDPDRVKLGTASGFGGNASKKGM